MVSVEKAVIAKVTKSGKKFEILVDPELAMQVRGGKSFNIDDLLATQDVYEDSKKGKKVSPDVINKTFGTNDLKIVAEKIIREGDVNLTTEQRHKMREDKRLAIAAIISRNGMNPQTGAPHPQERILNAMEETRVVVDISRRAEEQIEDIVKKIQKLIPISFEKVRIAIKIPAQFSAKGSGIIRKFTKPIKEQWGNDGSYLCEIKVAVGIESDIYDKLNSLTHGQVESKIKE